MARATNARSNRVIMRSLSTLSIVRFLTAGTGGGVSCKGCGCGYWIDVGFRLRPEFCTDVSPHLRPVIFKTVRECCWLIPDDSTVTETELYACEALVEGVSDICDKYFNEYLQHMQY
jgi:hypothetical protein